MNYDRKELEEWSKMEDWGAYLEKNGALAGNISTEQFKAIEQRYFQEVKKRANYCRFLIEKGNRDFFLYYTAATLYDKYNVDEASKYLYKRHVRYCCIKAIRLNRNYAPVWELLARTYEWLGYLGGEGITPEMDVSFGENDIIISIMRGDDIINQGTQAASLRYIRKALYCIKKALAIEPDNKKYQQILKGLYHQRNEEYRR